MLRFICLALGVHLEVSQIWHNVLWKPVLQDLIPTLHSTYISIFQYISP